MNIQENIDTSFNFGDIFGQENQQRRLSPQAQFMLRLEEALGFKRVVRKGREQVDARSGQPLLRITNKPFKGYYRAAELGSFVKEALLMQCRREAEDKIIPLFESHEMETLVTEGLALLSTRLRHMNPEDDPKAITAVFVAFYAQQDYLSNERTGETIRNITKKENAEARRREAGIAPRNFRNKVAVQPIEEMKADAPVVDEEELLDRPMTEEEFDRQADRLARKFSRKGIDALSVLDDLDI